MSNFLARWITAAAAFGSTAASAAPVTFAPGEGYGITGVTTVTPYATIQVFADISGIQAGDRFLASLFVNADGTGGGGTQDLALAAGPSVNDFQLLGAAGGGFADGSFSFDFGTSANSASSLTFDDVRIVLYSNDGIVVQTINVPTGTQAVSEPGTLALAACGLLAAGLGRRRRVLTTEAAPAAS